MKNMASMKSDEEYYYGDDGKDNEDDYWDGHQPDFELADDEPVPPPPPPTPPDCPQTPPTVSKWRSSRQSSEKGSSASFRSLYKTCSSAECADESCRTPHAVEHEEKVVGRLTSTRADDKSCISDVGRSNSTTMSNREMETKHGK